MFSNSRDAFSIALKRLGYSLNSTNEDEIIAAANEIKKQKSLVQAYVMDEIFNKMENEEALVAPYYAGDAVNMMKENSNLAFCYPKEGTNKFVDAMCIPKGSSKKELAYLYINFLTEPEIAAVNSTYIGYSTPNKEAAKLLSDEIRNNSIVYPSPEIIENTENYIHLPESINKLMDSQWTEIMSVNATHNKWLIPIFLVLGVTASVSINIIRNIKKRKDKML
jgi:spermidine/putrescine transport system substrate-binding protein